MPKLYIVAGCNGAGKTTASFTVLPEMLGCREFVNADEIARGLSPFNQGSVSFKAGRLMLGRINELLKSGADFAFETTLATRSYASFIRKARGMGYYATLIYFWLVSPEQAVQRVAMRVKDGGHDIPDNVIYRRYNSGIRNLFDLYMPVCDVWMIFDNTSLGGNNVVATGGLNLECDIYNETIFNKIKSYGREGN